MNKTAYIYTIIVALVAVAIGAVLDLLPRTRVSKLEKRELTEFPQFSWQKLADGSFTDSISTWFSDSEPFRDELMTVSMWLKQKEQLNLPVGNEQIVFHPSDDPMTDNEEENAATEDKDQPEDRVVEAYQNLLTRDENAKICNAGIIVIGQEPEARALMAFGGSGKGGVGYAQSANKYKETFPDVHIYCMVIPTSVEFYCPEQARKATHSEQATINNIFAHLRSDVHAVDVYTTLGQHAQEPIFLRTDHHWAPLGAYYAARKFAQVAGVPFPDLTHYDRQVVHGFVGTMYGYSKDISIKNSPEDFVYYVPRDATYVTDYLVYTIDRNYRVVGSQKGFTRGKFFSHFKDGSSAAYCTFMGGDTKITRVRTNTHNGRRLIILKDSFGNALPGYLFSSFEEIHVIDSRYFTKNMIAYVRENKITDILFANNIFKAYSSYTYDNYVKFLNQSGEGSGARLSSSSSSSRISSSSSSSSEASPVTPVSATPLTPDSL